MERYHTIHTRPFARWPHLIRRRTVMEPWLTCTFKNVNRFQFGCSCLKQSPECDLAHKHSDRIFPSSADIPPARPASHTEAVEAIHVFADKAIATCYNPANLLLSPDALYFASCKSGTSLWLLEEVLVQMPHLSNVSPDFTHVASAQLSNVVLSWELVLSAVGWGQIPPFNGIGGEGGFRSLEISI